jgi:hypothetical protein
MVNLPRSLSIGIKRPNVSVPTILGIIILSHYIKLFSAPSRQCRLKSVNHTSCNSVDNPNWFGYVMTEFSQPK